MIVNAKEMLKIQKQMEQKEKNRPIHSDYCLECGCPKDICCERRGRVEELTLLLKELVILEDESKLTEISFFKLRKKIIYRLKELQGVEK